jgi:M6 family metalloprotease-like protein
MYRLIALVAVFSFYNERAVSRPVDVEMTKRAYEELKLANKEALSLSPQENGGEQGAPFAMSATNSSDMQAVFGNLLRSVLGTRNSGSSLKLSKVPYPVLIVLVDFTDEDFEWDEATHRNLVFGEGATVEEFWDQNFHGAVDFTATPISSGSDGIITIEFDGPHPNLPDNGELSAWARENLGAYIVDYIDPVALDADFNGWLSREELTVYFVLAGPNKKGGGFATPINISIGNPLTLNGIKVHGYGVLAEINSWMVENGFSEEALKASLKSALMHEFGHLFGATDKYFWKGGNPFGYWSNMAETSHKPSRDEVYPPNAMALDKLETGMLESAEISSGGTISLIGYADALVPNGKLKEAKRVWLDPYKLRTSILLEHRSGTGFDAPVENVGLLAVAVESLATSSAFDDPETTYRKGVLIDGTGTRKSQGVGDLIDLTARQDTPGYAADPTWAATTGSISINAVGVSGSEINVDLQSYGPERGHIRYDRPHTAGYNAEDSALLAPAWWYRYGATEAESVTIFNNDTPFTQIDGFELRLGGPSEVTVTFYEDVIDNQPYSIISRETFTIGSVSENDGGEWHRAFLSNPVAFSPGSKIAFSTAIRRTDGKKLIIMQRRLLDLVTSQYSQKSVKNYWRPDETWSYMTDEDFAYGHILLMSQ